MSASLVGSEMYKRQDYRGIFPAAVDNSTDRHSMGQWIQEGERTIFETVVSELEQPP